MIPAFLSTHTHPDPAASTPTAELHARYLAWAGGTPMGPVAFNLAVTRARPDWTTKADDLETRAWQGVAMKGE